MIGSIITSAIYSATATAYLDQYTRNMKILQQQVHSRLGIGTEWKTLCECQFQVEPQQEKCENCEDTGRLPIPVEEVIQNDK